MPPIPGVSICPKGSTIARMYEATESIADLFESCGEKISHDGGQVGFPASLKVWTCLASQALVAKVFAHPYCGELLSLKANCCPPVLLTPNRTQRSSAERLLKA
jgi:hypothetical protein